MRAVARIPKIQNPPTTEALQLQIDVLHEIVDHLQERVELLETRDTLKTAARKAE